MYVVTPVLIVAFSLFTLWRDYVAHNWGNAAFAAFNAVVATWAILAYIGLGDMLVDIWLGLTDWMYVEVKPKVVSGPNQPEPGIDWRAVLYHGDAHSALPLSARSHNQSGGPSVKRKTAKGEVVAL